MSLYTDITGLYIGEIISPVDIQFLVAVLIIRQSQK